MKKVLIITYYWPPSSGGGVQRWLKFSKYLPEYNWNPIIYTPSNPTINMEDVSLMQDVALDIKILKYPIWEPYKLAGTSMGSGISFGVDSDNQKNFKKRILKFIRANIILPDPRRFWISPSVKFLQAYITKNSIDAIVSTGPPHSMHLIALRIKGIFPTIKWVADFRDPWLNFNFFLKLEPLPFARRYVRSLERQVVQRADKVLATSKSTYSFLEEFDKSKFQEITNGYDASDFSNYKDVSHEDKLIILHAGTIKDDRNPIHLWSCLDKALSDGRLDFQSFELRLVGFVDAEVKFSIMKFKYLSKCTTLVDYVGHNQLLENHYSQANVLLLLINNTRSSKANIPGKLFEYIYLDKPILAFGTSGDDALSIVKEIGGLGFDYKYKLKFSDILSLREKRYNSIGIEGFSRKAKTKELAELLNKLIQ